LLGASDGEQLEYLCADGRVLFTNDADFLRLHESGEIHPGIVYCHQQSRSIGQIIQGLELIWEVLESEEMHRCLEFL